MLEKGWPEGGKRDHVSQVQGGDSASLCPVRLVWLRAPLRSEAHCLRCHGSHCGPESKCVCVPGWLWIQEATCAIITQGLSPDQPSVPPPCPAAFPAGSLTQASPASPQPGRFLDPSPFQAPIELLRLLG